jgi:hypothetical protein
MVHMPSYEQLDRIADSHNPFFGIIWLLLCIVPLLHRQWARAAGRFGIGVGALIVAYGLMWLDSVTGLWSRIGLEYSTHTAVAVALASAIFASSRGIGIAAYVLLGLYISLMLYQRYHTVPDIASTAVAVGGPVFLLVYYTHGLVRTHPGPAANNAVKPKPLRGSA